MGPREYLVNPITIIDLVSFSFDGINSIRQSLGVHANMKKIFWKKLAFDWKEWLFIEQKHKDDQKDPQIL